MIPYFILFLIPAALTFVGRPGWGKSTQGRQISAAYAVLVAFMIGFRWRVGGDWCWANLRIIAAPGKELLEWMKGGDPGYSALVWLTAVSGFNIWVAHLIGGAIFAYGLRRLCLETPWPWLATTVAVPYLVIVVAMGYDRQAVAIGFLMLAMVALQRQSLKGFIINYALAGSMHSTALALMPIFIFASKIKKSMMIAISVPVFAGGYYLLLRDIRRRANARRKQRHLSVQEGIWRKAPPPRLRICL